MIFVAVFDTIFVAVFYTILIVSNNAGKTTGILRLFKFNSPYCSFQPASERTHVLLAPPLSISVSSVSVAIFFLVFVLTSSFITLYFSNSSNISLNSSIMLLSLKASETCEVIVYSFAEAIVLIFSCFSALEVNFFTLYLPIILRNPVKSGLLL